MRRNQLLVFDYEVDVARLAVVMRVLEFWNDAILETVK